MPGLLITGTDTEIGKTLITALLAMGLRRRGVDAVPVKPVASGGVESEDGPVSEDALAYRRIAGIGEPMETLNPFCLRMPASPHFAAERENATVPVDELLDRLRGLAARRAVLAEGIGGWLVPLTERVLVADFAQRLGWPVIAVSANRLGTINHTLLTLESIRNRGIEPAGVILTHLEPGGPTPIQRNNAETIERMGGADILGNVPHLESTLINGENTARLWETIAPCIQWNRIETLLNTPPKR